MAVSNWLTRDKISAAIAIEAQGKSEGEEDVARMITPDTFEDFRVRRLTRKVPHMQHTIIGQCAIAATHDIPSFIADGDQLSICPNKR